MIGQLLTSRLRLKPSDTSTEESRSRERHRRIALTVLASAAAKAITIGTSLITVPLTLNYLGAERYGLWMIISSVIAMMVFADFGIGNGLLNAIAEAYGRDDAQAMQTHVANALAILVIIAVIILVTFLFIYSSVQWGPFFNVTTTLAAQEAGPALAVFMACFAISVPAGIVQRVQMGLQQGFASGLWQAGGSVLGLLLTLLAIHFESGLPWLILALTGAPTLILVLNGLFFFFVQRRDLLPDLRYVSSKGMKLILHGGMLFFVLQLTVSIAFASDNLIIAKVINAEAVAQYSVISKLFEGFVMIIGLAFAPLWPAYGEAKARGDRSWIKSTLIRSMTLTSLIAIGTALSIIAFHKEIFAFWVGAEHSFPFSLVACYALWMVLKTLGATYSMFLNGMSVLRFQLILSVIFMFVSVAAKYFFTVEFGMIGLIFGLILSYLFVTAIPCALYTNRILEYR